MMFLLYCRSFISSTALQPFLSHSFHGTPLKSSLRSSLLEKMQPLMPHHIRGQICFPVLIFSGNRRADGWQFATLETFLGFQTHPDPFPSWYQSPLQKTFPQSLISRRANLLLPPPNATHVAILRWRLAFAANGHRKEGINDKEQFGAGLGVQPWKGPPT